MTRHRDLEADLHPSVIAARHLRATADTWPDLLVALDPSGASPTTGRVSGTSEHPMPISGSVHETITTVESWVLFWCRRLDEGGNWQMPPNETDHAFDIPGLLRELADHAGFFTETTDDEWQFADAFITEAAENRRAVDEAAYPSGYRKVPVGMTCVEDCVGEYRGVVPPDSRWTDVPVLKCSKNPRHTITPEELRRIQRRQSLGRLSNDPAVVRDYLMRLREHAPKEAAATYRADLHERGARGLLAAIKGETTPADNLRNTRRRRGVA